MRSFFGAQLWQTANSVWRILAHKFGLNFVDEIEWQFFAERCGPATFCLAHKGW